MNPRIWKSLAIRITLLALPLAMIAALATPAKPADSSATADEAAIKQVVTGFNNGWNTHDAHAMCLSLANDVEWVSWRGEVMNTRKGVEDQHAGLFTGLYKDSHRTDTVKAIRFLGPDLASVDNYWSMTGAKKRDGSDWPYREGYVNYLMARRDGRWMIIVSHTADFNATSPGSSSK